jgi:hypothetical protein
MCDFHSLSFWVPSRSSVLSCPDGPLASAAVLSCWFEGTPFHRERGWSGVRCRRRAHSSSRRSEVPQHRSSVSPIDNDAKWSGALRRPGEEATARFPRMRAQSSPGTRQRRIRSVFWCSNRTRRGADPGNQKRNKLRGPSRDLSICAEREEGGRRMCFGHTPHPQAQRDGRNAINSCWQRHSKKQCT